MFSLSVLTNRSPSEMVTFHNPLRATRSGGLEGIGSTSARNISRMIQISNEGKEMLACFCRGEINNYEALPRA